MYMGSIIMYSMSSNLPQLCISIYYLIIVQPTSSAVETVTDRITTTTVASTADVRSTAATDLEVETATATMSDINLSTSRAAVITTLSPFLSICMTLYIAIY